MLKHKDRLLKTDLAKKLYNKLVDYSNDTDFPLCIIAMLKSSEQKQQMLDNIDNLQTYDDVIKEMLKITKTI